MMPAISPECASPELHQERPEAALSLSQGECQKHFPNCTMIASKTLPRGRVPDVPCESHRAHLTKIEVFSKVWKPRNCVTIVARTVLIRDLDNATGH